MAKALITGGAGFIGRYLAVELRAHHWQVTIFDRQPRDEAGLESYVGDIEDANSLSAAAKNVDVIFHLAGLLGTDYLCSKAIDSVRANIIGSLNVFDVALARKIRVVHLGLLPDWDSSYMITKKTAMRFGRMYRREFKTDIRALEVSHVYGPGQRSEPYHKAIPTFISRALKDEPLIVYGSGLKLMDCLYVTDVAVALRLAAEKANLCASVLQLGSLEIRSVLRLAQTIIAKTGSRSRIEFRPMRPGEPDKNNSGVLPDTTAWTREFDWFPATKLSEGLRRTIDWYRLELERTAVGTT